MITAQAVAGLNPAEVTLAENRSKLIDSPLFILSKSVVNRGIGYTHCCMLFLFYSFRF